MLFRSRVPLPWMRPAMPAPQPAPVAPQPNDQFVAPPGFDVDAATNDLSEYDPAGISFPKGIEALPNAGPPLPQMRDQQIANQLDEAIFGAGPHRGDARTRPEGRWVEGAGGAPDPAAVPSPNPRPNNVPNPNMRPEGRWLEGAGGAPDAASVPAPNMRGRGTPASYSPEFPSLYGEQPQPELGTPTQIMPEGDPWADRYWGPRPTEGGGLNSLPGLPSGTRTAPSDLTPSQLDRVMQMQGIGPFPTRPGMVSDNTAIAPPNPYLDGSRQFDTPGAFTRMNMEQELNPFTPPAPVSNTPPIGNLNRGYSAPVDPAPTQAPVGSPHSAIRDAYGLPSSLMAYGEQGNMSVNEPQGNMTVRGGPTMGPGGVGTTWIGDNAPVTPQPATPIAAPSIAPLVPGYGSLPGVPSFGYEEEPGTVPATGLPEAEPPAPVEYEPAVTPEPGSASPVPSQQWAPFAPRPMGGPAQPGMFPGMPSALRRVVSPQGRGIMGGIAKLLSGGNQAMFQPAGNGLLTQGGNGGVLGTFRGSGPGWSHGTTNAAGGTNALCWNNSQGNGSGTVATDPFTGTYYGPTYSTSTW